MSAIKLELAAMDYNSFGKGELKKLGRSIILRRELVSSVEELALRDEVTQEICAVQMMDGREHRVAGSASQIAERCGL